MDNDGKVNEVKEGEEVENNVQFLSSRDKVIAEIESSSNDDSSEEDKDHAEEGEIENDSDASGEKQVPDITESKMVEVTIDGEKKYVPLDVVRASYQKQEAADKRLHNANVFIADAKAEAEMIVAKAKEDADRIRSEKISASNEEKDEEAKISRRERAKFAIEKMIDGDSDTAAEVFEELTRSGKKEVPQLAFNAEEVEARVFKRLEEKILEKEVTRVYEGCRSDYPELFEDSDRGNMLGQVAISKAVEKEASGLSRIDALREAVEEVASVFGIKKQGRQDDVISTANNAKLERKKTLDNIIPASAVAKSVGGAVNTGTDRNSVIDEIIRSRSPVQRH